MDNIKGKISKILGAVEEAKGLLNEFVTPELISKMTPEQKEKLEEVEKLTGEDLKKSVESLHKINLNSK
jgi:hypothetical protein